jgi:3-oxosteroid 1-dehydrogenase
VIDSNGSALGYDDNPIPGLFACGNVAASAFGVAYPGGGGTIGQAVVFGYLAGRAIGQDLVSTAKRGHQATAR